MLTAQQVVSINVEVSKPVSSVCVSECVSVRYGEAHFSLLLVWSRRITMASVSLFRYALPSGMSAGSRKRK